MEVCKVCGFRFIEPNPHAGKWRYLCDSCFARYRRAWVVVEATRLQIAYDVSHDDAQMALVWMEAIEGVPEDVSVLTVFPDRDKVMTYAEQSRGYDRAMREDTCSQKEGT